LIKTNALQLSQGATVQLAVGVTRAVTFAFCTQ